ncbi:MAG: ABC transporter substrate binding protein [Desulfuromonadales bacterium]|nr:ABC transporter substrate binding protein [Desulfuromonadales bacterium]
MRSFPLKLCLLALLWSVLSIPQRSLAEDAVAVLMSREIAPYVTMVEGMEAGLGNLPVQRFFLDKQGAPYSLGDRGAVLAPANYAALVAVGPEALRYLLPRGGGVPIVYGMILNPESVAGAGAMPLCGVSLNLPVRSQLAALRQYLPAATRLGILFDPANNQAWFDQAVPVAASMGIQLSPLHVSRAGDKLDILGGMAELDGVLFIPDKSIIAKAVIQHVIKEAALHGVPVIGYNLFFHDSGATLSFIIDYPAVGRQVADQIQQILGGGRCAGSSEPVFRVRVNEEARRALGVRPASGGAR